MELLDEIRRAESAGEQLVAKAKQESEEIIRLAHEDARVLLRNIEEECGQHESRLIAEAEKAAQEKARQAHEKNQEALEALRAGAQQSTEPAVKSIIESIAGNSEWP
jgi:vacuolar-type H+-ATPase subunit H